MDIVRQDPEFLALRRAAGILNVSVDELLQVRRGPPEGLSSTPPLEGGGTGSRLRYDPNDSYREDEQYATYPVNGSDDTFWYYSQGQNVDPQQQYVDHFAHAELATFPSERPGSHRQTSSQDVLHVSEPMSQDRVILLNPEVEHVWYACNLDYEMIGFNDISASGHNTSSGATDSFVQVTPGFHDSYAASESTARDDDMDMLSVGEDDHTLSLPTPADRCSSSSLGSRQFKLIAPRPGTLKSPSDSSGPKTTTSRVRKKRARYSASSRDDTNFTRVVHACIRCKMQRNRVCFSSLLCFECN